MAQEELDLEYELKILGAMKSRIKGHPLCHRSGCHGAGVLGIKMVLVEGIMKPQLLTCSCAVFGETEYKRLYDEVTSLEAQTRNYFLALDETLVKIHRSTPFGFIAWKFGVAWQVIRNCWYGFRKLVNV